VATFSDISFADSQTSIIPRFTAIVTAGVRSLAFRETLFQVSSQKGVRPPRANPPGHPRDEACNDRAQRYNQPT
jgi:hypothetical protein